MWRITLALLCLISSAVAGEKMSATQLINLAKSGKVGLRDAIMASFDAKDLKEGTAWAGRGPDFFFVTQSASEPALVLDSSTGTKMLHLADSDIWYAAARVELVGGLHAFHYLVNGAKFGGQLDAPAFGPLS